MKTLNCNECPNLIFIPDTLVNLTQLICAYCPKLVYNLANLMRESIVKTFKWLNLIYPFLIRNVVKYLKIEK